MTICFPRVIDRTSQCPVDLLTFSPTPPTCVRVVPVRADEIYAVGERPRVHYLITDDGEVYQLAPTQDNPSATPPRWHALLGASPCILVGIEFSNMVQSHILPIQIALLPGVLRIILLQFSLTVADVQNGLPPSQCRPTLFADIITATTNCLTATPPSSPSLRFGCDDARGCFNTGSGVSITGTTSPYTINAGLLTNPSPDTYQWTSATGSTFDLYPTQRYFLRAGGNANQFEETRNLLFLEDSSGALSTTLYAQDGTVTLPNLAYNSAVFIEQNDDVRTTYTSFLASNSSQMRISTSLNSDVHGILATTNGLNAYGSSVTLNNVSLAPMDVFYSLIKLDGANLSTPGSSVFSSVVLTGITSTSQVQYVSTLMLNPLAAPHRDVTASIASVFILGLSSPDRPVDNVPRNATRATFILADEIRMRNQTVNSISPFLHVVFGRNTNETMSMFQVTENFQFADVDADNGFDFVIARANRLTMYAFSWPSSALLFLPAHRGTYNPTNGQYTPLIFANDAAAANSILTSYVPGAPQIKPGALTMAFVAGRPALFAFDGVQWVRITV